MKCIDFINKKIGFVKMVLSYNYSEFVGEIYFVVKIEILCDKWKICDMKNYVWYMRIDREKRCFYF